MLGSVRSAVARVRGFVDAVVEAVGAKPSRRAPLLALASVVLTLAGASAAQAATLGGSIGTSGTAYRGQTSYLLIPTFTNTGTAAAGGVGVTINLPTGMLFRSLSAPAGWSCFTPNVGEDAGVINCNHTASYANGAVSNFQLLVDIASGAAASLTVQGLITDGGTSATPSANVTVTNPPAPTVTSVSPNNVSTRGGTSVVLTGSGFSGVTAVNFGSTAAASYTVDSPTQITAVTPAVAGGTVNVRVTAAGGTSATAAFNEIAFTVPAPTISGISPASGSSNGGTTVTLTGTNFIDTALVRFGSTAATSFTVDSDTQITAVTPARVAGQATVFVFTPGGTAQVTNGFTYLQLAPEATSFTFGSIVGYNPGGGEATSFNLAWAASNSPTSFAVGSSTTAQGGSVSIDSSGQVTYTPPAGYRGNDSFAYTATNSYGTSASATVTLTVGNPTFSLGAALPSGKVGAPYNATVVLADGMAPYTAFLATGLPPGLSISSTGVVSGTPTTIGAYTPTLTATDSSTGTGHFNGSVSAAIAIASGADLQASVTGVNTVDVDQTAAFTAQVSNTGTGPTAGVVAQLVLPPETTFVSLSAPGGWTCSNPPVGANGTVSCSTASFAAGAVATFTLVLKPVANASADSQSLTLNVISDTESETATKTFALNKPDLQVTLAGPASVVRGQTATLTATLANAGAAPTPTTSWSINLPAGVTFVSLSAPGGWSCATPAVGGGGSVGCAASGLAAGASHTMTLVVEVGAGATSPTTVNLTGLTTWETENASTSFTVVDTAPSLTAITAPRGPSAGGTNVVLHGDNLAGATAVSWGGTPIAFLPISNTQIQVTTPAGTVGTAVSVTVTTPAGVSGAVQFAYVDTPTVVGLTPSEGPTAGGVNVVVHGTNLSAASDVMLGGVSVPFTMISDEALQITTPAHAAGVVDVTVTVPYIGTSLAGAAARFTYYGAPTISSVNPSVAASGASVTISGTGFNPTPGLNSVTFDGTPATVTAASATSLTVTAPAHAPGVVTVVVMATGGTASSSFTYAAPSDLTVSLTGPVSAVRGEAVELEFTVANVGSGTSGTVQIQVPLPAGMLFQSLSAPPFFTCSRPTVGASGTATCSHSFVPTETGTFRLSATIDAGMASPASVTVTVTGDGQTKTASHSIALSNPVVTLPSSLSSATVGQPYAQSVAAAGAAGYSATGALPAGLSLNASTGEISGTPTAGGSFSFTVNATAASGYEPGAQAYTLTVAVPTVAVGPSSLPNGRQASAYSQTLTASGGTAGYAWSVTSGALPDGVTLSEAGVLSGTPSVSGAFTFTVTARDSSTGTGPYTGSQTYTWTVDLPPAPTVADLSGVAVAYDSAGTAIDLSSRITGVHGSIAVGSGPAHGTVSVAGDVVTYTPAAGYYGADSFTYTATGPGGTSAPATVSLTVATPAAPTAAGVSGVAVGYNSAGTAIDLSARISGVHASIAVGASPAHGTVTVAGDVVTYTPAAGYYGADSFTYTATGPGGTSAPATVSLTVATPAAPTVAAVSGVAVGYNSTGTAIDLSARISGVHASIAVATAPAHGTVSVAGDVVTYTPAAGYYGADSFTYTATGPGGTSAPATVSLTVANPPPPVPVPQSEPATANVDGSTEISVGNSGGVATSVTITTPPSHGSVSVRSTAGSPVARSAALAGAFVITYTPEPGFAGTDSFAYALVGPGGTSAPAAINVTVAPLPAGQDKAVSVLAGQSVTVDLAAGASGGPYTSAAASSPAQGTVAVSGLNAVYTAPVSFAGTTSFTYTLNGQAGSTAPATVTVTVNPAPTAQAIAVTTLQGVAVKANLTAGAAGGPFTGAAVVSVGPSEAGTATVAQVGSDRILTFTPAPDFTGTAVVGFTLTNAYATSAPSTVTVTVEARPDPSKDADVRGLIGAQVQAAQRFADAQMSNFNQRAEALHREGDQEGPRSNALNLGLGFGDYAGRMADPAEELRRREMPEQPFADQLRREEMLAATGRADAPAAAASDRPAGGGKLALWSAGTVDFGQRRADAGGAKLKFTTSGVSVGADVEVADGVFVGAGVGYGYDATDIGSEGTRNASRAYMGAVYGSWRIAPQLFVDGVAGVGRLSFDSRRRAPSDVLVFGRREGDQAFGSLGLAWDLRDGPWTLSPYGRLTVSRATLDAFTETGDPIYALRYEAQDVETSAGTLGLRGDYVTGITDGTFTPHFRAEWRRQFEGAGSAAVRYADFLTGPAYQVDPLARDANALLLGVGGDWRWDRGLFFSLDWEGVANDETLSQRITAKLLTRF